MDKQKKEMLDMALALKEACTARKSCRGCALFVPGSGCKLNDYTPMSWKISKQYCWTDTDKAIAKAFAEMGGKYITSSGCCNDIRKITFSDGVETAYIRTSRVFAAMGSEDTIPLADIYNS